jgi:hypothetical protein
MTMIAIDCKRLLSLAIFSHDLNSFILENVLMSNISTSNVDWTEVVKSKKGVRTTDNLAAGNVVAESADSITVLQGALKQHEFTIPKSLISGYNGTEIDLKLSSSELSSYEPQTRQNVKQTKSVEENVPETEEQDKIYEEGAPGTEIGRKDDPLTEYREKEAMTPAKEKAHEPTAVRRDPGDQKIVQPDQVGTNPEEAAEIARKKGMAKGTAGAAETGSEYEQGVAGANK